MSELRILDSRDHASDLLAERLRDMAMSDPLILGIPRGGAVMAVRMARLLSGEVDVVLVRKLRDPGSPEVAIGSVDEEGHVYLNEYAGHRSVSPAYLEHEKIRQLELLRQRRGLYTPVREPVNPEGRDVVVVDDGLATGSTMISALRAIRARNPARLVAAAGVAPPDTVQKIEDIADKACILVVPDDFMAVSQFFRDFEQVSEEETIKALVSDNQ